VGDLPSPIKYSNRTITQAYGELEKAARRRLVDMLPPILRADFDSLLQPSPADDELKQIVAAADKICAYLKCLEERRAGNLEFSEAEKTIEAALERAELPEVRYFLDHFIPSFTLTLDELN